MEIAGLIFVLIVVAIGYVAFRLLKKTVKFALRLLLLIVILLAALVGGLALWNYGG